VGKRGKKLMPLSESVSVLILLAFVGVGIAIAIDCHLLYQVRMQQLGIF
jgi:hypothetical protein